MDRCHGVNTGAGHVSKGKSPVAQLSLKALSEHHQGRDLKQRLSRKKKGISEGWIVLTVEDRGAVISKSPKQIYGMKTFSFSSW